MSLSGRVTVFCALAVVCAVASGEAEGLTPGKHRRIVCKGAPQWTYDLYVPAAYGEDAERLFPVLFLSSPGGNPGTYGMENWAERNSVILVSINDTRNDQDPGLEKPTWVKIQGTVVDSAEARLRLHPCLRFSMGISGAAWARSYVEEAAKFMQELAREIVKVSIECYGKFAEAEAASTRRRCEREVTAVQAEAAGEVSQRFRHDRVSWRHIEAHEVDSWLDGLKSAEADVLEDARDTVEEERLKQLARRSAEPADEETGPGPPVRTRHVSMNEIAEELHAIASKNCTILLTGEPGTGKGFWAQRVHDLSGREGELVPVLCPTMSKDLFESELFGHRKGAFTGAVDKKDGLVEAAADGTLFLDEIAELPPHVQAKLLYLLQERTFRRVGETEDREAQCRVILATNRDLRELVRSGGFREDLLSRINTFAFHLPPLRERRDEIPELLRAFQEEFSPTRHRRISAEDCKKLRDADYDWPGNIRTLRAAVERTFMLSGERYVSAASILGEAKKLAAAGGAG